MFFAGVNFILWYQAIFKRDIWAFWKNSEFRFYTSIIVIGTVFSTIMLQIHGLDSVDTVANSFRNIPLEGGALVEAMARKVPVIAGQSSGAVPWVLSGGEAGLLVDVSSVDTLVQSILRLAMDRGLWKSFSESGYRNALRRFNSNEVAKDVISLYHQVIEET